MRKDIRKGTVYAIVSALVFGLTPILASKTFEMGSNAMTLTFFRNSLAVPVLLVMLLVRKVDIRLRKGELLPLLLIGVGFSATTTYLVYAAYDYIGVGLSTTLHFLYPVCTVLLGWLLFHKKPDKSKIIALVLATAGVALATGETESFAVTGIALAGISAVTYAAYMLGIEHTAVGKMDSMKAMLYMCLINAAAIFLFDLPRGEIVYVLPPAAMIYTIIVTVANSAFAYVLLIQSVKLIGSGNAAIFSMLEPVSGVVGGVIFLHESMPVMKLISCILILTAVMIPILRDRNSEKEEDSAEKL